MWPGCPARVYRADRSAVQARENACRILPSGWSMETWVSLRGFERECPQRPVLCTPAASDHPHRAGTCARLRAATRRADVRHAARLRTLMRHLSHHPWSMRLPCAPRKSASAHRPCTDQTGASVLKPASDGCLKPGARAAPHAACCLLPVTFIVRLSKATSCVSRPVRRHGCPWRTARTSSGLAHYVGRVRFLTLFVRDFGICSSTQSSALLRL